jgi:hypothetical protein
MSFTIALIALQAAVQAPPPPAPPPRGMVSNSPPPIVRTNVPPPPVMTVHTAPPMATPILAAPDLPAPSPVLLDIRVSGDGGIIWEGSLRVGPSASYSENRSESRATPCSPYLGYDPGLRSGFTLNLSHYSTREKPNQFSVGASWSRPANPQDCAEPGSRSVQFQQTVELAPGTERVVQGDGGLSVRLRRR